MSGGALTRRQVLGAGLASVSALATSACTGATAPEPSPPPDPDVTLRTTAAERERALLTAYDAAVAALPAQALLLGGLRAQHAEHLALLTAPSDGSPTSSGAATPSPIAPGPAASASAPGSVLAALVALERATSGAHAEATLQARERDLAVLLGTLAASEASHPLALTSPAGPAAR